MLSEQTLRSGLTTRSFGRKIYAFGSIDSTNNCAKAIAGCGGLEGTIVIAEEQTSGKGRLGRTWVAKPNENLMFSIVLRPQIPPDALNVLPLLAAVGVAAAIEKSTGLKVECKWPNDLLLNGRKFAGILIEGSVKQNTVEYVVVGIGINVNQSEFPSELSDKATSLRIEARKKIGRAGLFREVVRSLEEQYAKAALHGFDSIVPLWLGRTTMLNKPVSVLQQGHTISGVMTGLSRDGGLVLSANGEETVVRAGDTTVLKV
jgi:BirA family biotin operon repressor/biotin-[acetyl-CoA-carboxylase] ligase